MRMNKILYLEDHDCSGSCGSGCSQIFCKALDIQRKRFKDDKLNLEDHDCSGSCSSDCSQGCGEAHPAED